MKVELFSFQKSAESKLRAATAEALGSYKRTHTPQVVSFTAPTGAGKTVILASLVENIYFGNDQYPEQPEAIFVWLSDSPELNEQSKLKFDFLADKIKLSQCITVSDESFNKEVLEDGHIYFLNTQKLGKSSNLTKHSDSRQYTIWETLKNTVREKPDRLYFIIDEAHRGMQGKEAGRATTIMQKFIKGSSDDGLDPMPVVIDMSATSERFNKLVSDTTSTIQKVVVKAEDVRASGLLKDRIIITYPEESIVNKDMAVLQAAADDWKHKWEHWRQYCTEQHYAQVNPVFVVQVQNGTRGDNISDTDLDDCLKKIEKRTGFRFKSGEVVHTFGQTSAPININGLEVRYMEPSRIANDKQIKIVFFKENLSTGWDCPRAETMMSFRNASDATYIAQLLGRMVRTPMQMHIQVDDTLNDVHLFLPHFNKNTVQNVVEALQNTEGGDIPTDIDSESINNKKYETLTVRPKSFTSKSDPEDKEKTLFSEDANKPVADNNPDQYEEKTGAPTDMVAENKEDTKESTYTRPQTKIQVTTQKEKETSIDEKTDKKPEVKSPFNREEIVKAINDMGLLTYNVRDVQINNYRVSLYDLARLLTQSGLYPAAIKDVVNEIVGLIRNYIEELKDANKYDELVKDAKLFKLKAQIFDVFGETVDNYAIHDLFSTTDTDIDRQFRLAENRLGNEGVGNAYGKMYSDDDNPDSYKIDVILFAADNECWIKLNNFAQQRFYELNDKYRRLIVKTEDRYQNQYRKIASNGDVVSKQNFKLPETIKVKQDFEGNKYTDHLFVNDDGIAHINLNGWEEGVLQEEQKRPDFVCWLRNPSRQSWSLCIPYEADGKQKPTYPDFIIIRKEPDGYVVDVLEPHNPSLADNLGKAKGFAEYARQNNGIGRIQLIRMGKNAAGKNSFKRLDMSKSAIRDKVSRAMSNDELDHIFDTDGQFE